MTQFLKVIYLKEIVAKAYYDIKVDVRYVASGKYCYLLLNKSINFYVYKYYIQIHTAIYIKETNQINT